MFRNIMDFQGDCLIVGGGWNNYSTFPYRTKEAFYTIDIDASCEPDLVADFLLDSALLESHFKGRFKFIYFEYFPLYEDDHAMAKLFQTAFNLLTSDGVLLYIGGSFCLDKTIPQLLAAVGFQFATSSLKDQQPNDKGSVTLACKIDIQTKEDLNHLPKEAHKCIENCHQREYEHEHKFEIEAKYRKLHFHSPVSTKSSEKMAHDLYFFPSPMRRLQPTRTTKSYLSLYGSRQQFLHQRLKKMHEESDRHSKLAIKLARK